MATRHSFTNSPPAYGPEALPVSISAEEITFISKCIWQKKKKLSVQTHSSCLSNCFVYINCTNLKDLLCRPYHFWEKSFLVNKMSNYNVIVKIIHYELFKLFDFENNFGLISVTIISINCIWSWNCLCLGFFTQLSPPPGPAVSLVAGSVHRECTWQKYRVTTKSFNQNSICGDWANP